MSQRKQLVLDTSVLLYDKESIHSFPGNDVILPLIVLDELDRFKEKPGLLGESARYVNRYLDHLRSLGSLQEGVHIEEVDQIVRVMIESAAIETSPHLDASRGDNMIISAALHCQNKNANDLVKVITKDINLRVKCDALGLAAEDYYRDYISLDGGSFTGVSQVEVTNGEIDALYSQNKVETEELLFPNTYLSLIHI